MGNLQNQPHKTKQIKRKKIKKPLKVPLLGHYANAILNFAIILDVIITTILGST
jgi:CMP-N-acetylneuraminic acid synthetase